MKETAVVELHLAIVLHLGLGLRRGLGLPNPNTGGRAAGPGSLRVAPDTRDGRESLAAAISIWMTSENGFLEPISAINAHGPASSPCTSTSRMDGTGRQEEVSLSATCITDLRKTGEYQSFHATSRSRRGHDGVWTSQLSWLTGFGIGTRNGLVRCLAAVRAAKRQSASVQPA